MKNSKTLIALLVIAMAFGACSSNKKEQSASDSTMNSTGTDTMGSDTSAVKPADSTHSYRNDRGTDSVSAGKSIPSKP